MLSAGDALLERNIRPPREGGWGERYEIVSLSPLPPKEYAARRYFCFFCSRPCTAVNRISLFELQRIAFLLARTLAGTVLSRLRRVAKHKKKGHCFYYTVTLLNFNLSCQKQFLFFFFLLHYLKFPVR
jgi:hypothetical protein